MVSHCYFLYNFPTHHAFTVSTLPCQLFDHHAEPSSIYVALPKIAQKGVDDSTLDFKQLDFLNPTPNSITITQKGTLHSPSIFTPTLDPFTASMYLVTNGVRAAKSFSQINMPSIHALHPTSDVGVDNQTVQIADVNGLADFATAVLTSEYVTNALSGSTNLHLGALPVVPINYNSQSTFKGLNGLAGFNVTGIKLDIGAKPGTPNIKGFAFIPNPSVMTIAMVCSPFPFSACNANPIAGQRNNGHLLLHRRRPWQLHHRKHDTGAGQQHTPHDRHP